MARKIISGLRYDTETALEIGTYSNDLPSNDFRHKVEVLFVTVRGRYFLWGTGGPLSSWGRPCGDGTCGGSDIIALTDSEALEWASDHLDADIVARHFENSIEEA